MKWIDINDGMDRWFLNRERVIVLWKEGDRAKVGIGLFHGGSWLVDGEVGIQPTHFIPLPDKPDNYEDWEY